jgi:hypothetical protein
MEDHFKRFPSVEILADAFEPAYRIRYIECVEEVGVIRFVRHEGRIPRDELESILERIIERAGASRG